MPTGTFPSMAYGSLLAQSETHSKFCKQPDDSGTVLSQAQNNLTMCTTHSTAKYLVHIELVGTELSYIITQ